MSYSITEFELLYTENIVRCLGLAIGMLGDEDDARDVVHDVFLKLWESNIKITNPEAFIIRSVRNACLDRIRSISVKDRIRQSMPIEPITSDEDIGLRHDDLLHAIETQLTNRERQVIEKIYDEGLSYKATADRLDVSVSTVNKNLVSAMKTLRNHFNSKKE